MKTKVALLYAILLIFLNCNSIDNSPPIDEELLGEWSLINYSAGLSQPLSLSQGDIIWDFQKKGVLKVTINPSLNYNPQLEPGEYFYTFGDSKIYVNQVYYDYEVIDNELIISDEPESDGPLMKFNLYQ